jgi:hypothetical protein
MTTTYNSYNNPWHTDGKLRKRLDAESNARQLAGQAIDMLGIVSVYAGRDWEGNTKYSSPSMFPGRALITKRSDPARNMKLPHVPVNHSSRRRSQQLQEQEYYHNEQQQAQQNYHDEQGMMMMQKQQQQQQQQVGFNDQFNQQYFAAHQNLSVGHRNNNNNSPMKQGGMGFQYADISELDDLPSQNNNNNNNSTRLHQQQQSRSAHFAPNESRNSPTRQEAIEQQMQIREEIRQQQMEEMNQEQLAEFELNRQIAEQHDLYLYNSLRDIKLARECRYGISSSKNRRQKQQQQQSQNDDDGQQQQQEEADPELRDLSPLKRRKLMRQRQKQQFVAAPVPLDPRDFPVQPTSFATVYDKPLVYCPDSGDFVRRGDAYGSFPKSKWKSSEIQQRMEERKTGKSAALHKAIEEIKFNDRAMLVNVPWKFSNHKNNQCHYLGGGTGAIAQPDFLDKNAV